MMNLEQMKNETQVDEDHRPHTNQELQSLYDEGKSVDGELFSEQRSNLQLIVGEHYTKKASNFYKRLRDSKDLTEQQKIRLTKNHIHNIQSKFVNNLLSTAPGVSFMPKNESEIQDQKSAELHEAVWQHVKQKVEFDELVDEFAEDFYGIGEVAAKIFWNPYAGKIKAYEQKLVNGEPQFQAVVDPQTGEPTRIPVPGDPIYYGQLEIEPIYGFNIFRDAGAKKMKDSPFIGIVKTEQTKKLLQMVGDDEEKKKFIVESSEDTMNVFDGTKGSYSRIKGYTLVMEFHFRPSKRYPNGYYFIKTREGIIFQGEHPGGIFPIVFEPCLKVQTSPRGRSPIKIARPYQVEINRAASKMAEHQISLGDDKLILVNNAKTTPGSALPGMRSINVSGPTPPTILAGRDGSQYLNYQLKQVEEMYQVLGFPEELADMPAQVDPYTMLFQAASQKKRHVRTIKRFERFLIKLAETSARLCKVHMEDDEIVQAVGRSEQINIEEFKNASDLCYQVKVQAQTEDVESKLGKQLALNHAIQYAGPKLEREDIGKILKAMPYGNAKETFGDLTLDYDSATNEILALDRGQMPVIHDSDNHGYMAKRLVTRTRQGDFQFLKAEIQQMYYQAIQQHSQMEAQRQIQLQRMKDGYIPTGGYMVKADLYVPDPKDPLKTKRAVFPYESLQWLIKQMEAQGQGLDQLEALNSPATIEGIGMEMERQQLPQPMQY